MDESPTIAAAVHSLGRVARERIEDVCDRAFEETFQNDPSVFVVRKVQTRVAVLASQAALESRLAEQWGARLCASVIRVIASTSSDEDVVRFENQAAFVSSFLSDFVAGTVWDHWYHGAFRVYRQVPADEAILAVLVENQDCLGEILHRLAKAKALDVVLRALGPEGQRRLWIRVSRRTSVQLSGDAFRIFVHSAFDLADSLSLWSASRPSEQDFLRNYLLTEPVSPNWTDPSSLASAVTDVFRALFGNGWLSVPRAFRLDDPSKLDSALNSSYDWLDKSWLKNSLASLFSPVSPERIVRASALRPPRLTPGQLSLFRSLFSSIRNRHFQLDPSDWSPHSHLLRILAALAARETSASLATLPILENIVEAWLALRTAENRDSDLLNLRRGQIDFILARVSPSTKISLQAHLESVVSAGEPAIAIVEELLAHYASTSEAPALEEIHSGCAGLFLLARAVQDLRLFTLLKESRFDSLEPLLVALAIRISGPAALQEGKFDAGAALWSGISTEEFPSHLSHLAKLDARLFRANLTELVAAQRIVDPIFSGEFADQPLSVALPPDVGSVLDFTASSLLHSWARWLPGLSGSSVGFLLEKFVHRSGTLHLYPDRIDVKLSPGPLDAILKMAGYLTDSPNASWLGNRFVRFRATS